MSSRGEAVDQGEVKDDNRQVDVASDGDANANDIPAEDGGGTEDRGTLSTLATETGLRDKVVIWGTDSQIDDPELAEFEMLECQELEAFLVEEEEDFVGLSERKDPCNLPSVDATPGDGLSKGGRNTERCGASGQGAGSSRVSECVVRTEVSSENDGFLSCLSTVSSLGRNLASAPDTVGRTKSTDPGHVQSGTMSEDLTQASQSWSAISDRGKVLRKADRHCYTSGRRDVDMNSNSPVLSEDTVLEAQVNNGVPPRKEHIRDIEEHITNLNQRCRVEDEQSGNAPHTTLREENIKKVDKSTQAEEAPDMNHNPPKAESKGTQPSVEAVTKQASFERLQNKQNSFERTFKKQPSFESTLKKQSSFDDTHAANPSSLERRKPWGSPSRPTTPVSPKMTCSPKRKPPGSPAKTQSTRVASLERGESPSRGANLLKQSAKVGVSSSIPKPITSQQKDSASSRSSPPQKPKNIRPKIITYVRKGPQAKPEVTEGQNDATTQPPRLSSFPSPPASKDPTVGLQSRASPMPCSSKLLFDKHRQEVHKASCCPPGVTAVKAPSNTSPHKPSGKSQSFQQHLQEHPLQEVGGMYRCTPKPQLGIGAVARQPSPKTKVPPKVQRSAVALNHSAQAAGGTTHEHEDPTGDNRKPRPEATPRCPQLRPGQSGLRPPGFSSLPAARLASFGFIRSGSVSSVSSNKSNDGALGDPCCPQQFRGRSPAGRGGARCERRQESERSLLRQLREVCEDQALQLQHLQARLKKASLAMEVFAVTTQYFCQKSESAVVTQGELSSELARIRDEVASIVARWEHLQQDKEELECRFNSELRELWARQQGELEALEERLRARHAEESLRLQRRHRQDLEELHATQLEQIEEMSEGHQEALVETQKAHNDTLVTLREEHARTVKNLTMAHEQQRKSLEEGFEKLRLSLQDQVDTLTFQNRSLRDRAKRFEEALLRSTDEQILEALAPYQHIEEDLKSLKEVLEMKNQQIHQQEQKISELEIMAEKNVYLEERVQVLQQHNEDLKARIDQNLAVSRQLSEENANLQVHVENESKEKNRLSRTNEELLWRLQTGELSPRMSPNSSPVHLPSPGHASPARPRSYPQ